MSDSESEDIDKLIAVVANDDEMQLHIQIELFKRNGFKTIGAKNGYQAYQIVKDLNPT